MSQRTGSSTPYVVGFLVLALAAVAGLWQLDVKRHAGRQAASLINDKLRNAELSLAELRADQAAYLASGLNTPEWLNKATTALTQLENSMSVLSNSSTTANARPHLDLATTLVADLSANDRKARGYVTSGQPLVAADVLFQEGAEPARRLADELLAARTAELAEFEKSATQLGWIGVGANGGAFLIGLILLVLAARGRGQATAGEASESVHLNAINTSGSPSPSIGTPETSRPAPPVDDPFQASSVDLGSAAELCVDLGRIMDGNDLPGLMGRAAGVLEAKGLVLWVSETGGRSLRPSVSHGYSERVVQRMGTLPTDGDNVTSLAFRTMQPQVVRVSFEGHGAIAVPLITGSGCVGVLAAEVQGVKPGDTRFAVARMIAAQLSTLVGPTAAAANTDAR